MKEIGIIGGGVAGLALGIALRKRNIPVTLWEAGKYPRHRVCGEFISGAGQTVLCRLGLEQTLLDAGLCEARTGLVAAGQSKSPIRAFPEPALCISRYNLDAALAREFERVGGCLLANTPRSEFGPGIVRATGRRSGPGEPRDQWYGLKAHVKDVQLEADLELHAAPGGYVGLCRLAGNVVNVCGLFRRGTSNALADKRTRLMGDPGSILYERLQQARFDESSFCATAGLMYRGTPFARDCSIGDAYALSPPATGNGMSKALESAWLAAGPITSYSAGQMSWETATAETRRLCKTAFSARLIWGRCLHLFFVSSCVRSRVGTLLLGSEVVWKLLFCRTRAGVWASAGKPKEAI